MQKRLPEIMLQKPDETVEPGEHDGDGEERLEEEEQDEEGGGGDGEVDGAGEEEVQGDEGAQSETEIEPQKCGKIFTQSSSQQVVNIQCTIIMNIL